MVFDCFADFDRDGFLIQIFSIVYEGLNNFVRLELLIWRIEIRATNRIDLFLSGYGFYDMYRNIEQVSKVNLTSKR